MKYLLSAALFISVFFTVNAFSEDSDRNPLKMYEQEARKNQEIAYYNNLGTESGEAIYRAWYFVNDPCYDYGTQWGMSLYGQERCHKTHISRATRYITFDQAQSYFNENCYEKLSRLCKINSGWRAFGK